MKNLIFGVGLLLSGTFGIVGTLVVSAIGGTYGNARSIMHINLEVLMIVFVLIFILGLVFALKGMKETV